MTREEAIKDLKDFIDTYITCHGEEDTIAVSLDNVDVEAFSMAIKALEQESYEDIVNRKLEELFERVENIEKQIKEDKEEQLKRLKAELDYAKFHCTL